MEFQRLCEEVCDEFDHNTVTELRYRSTCYLGCGAINKIDDICKAMIADGDKRRVAIVTGGSSYKHNGVWPVVEAAMLKNGMQFQHYSGATPNPTDIEADAAVAQFRAHDPQWILAIGGGSPVDTAKAVAILMCYPDKSCRDLMTFSFTPDRALPLVAINTSHGTGTEVDRFAVVSVNALHTKPVIAYDVSYPKFSIDDPNVMVTLSKAQTAYVSVDALAHVTEAATSKAANPFTISLGQQVGRLVAKYLPRVLANGHDMQARYQLTYASAIAGAAFDTGLLHFTHSMEHVASGLHPEIFHGFGLAILMPAVFKACWPAKGRVLASILGPIVPGLTGAPEEADRMYVEMEKWFYAQGMNKKLGDFGFTEQHWPEYLRLLRTTAPLPMLLGVAPVEATDEVLHRIFSDSLSPRH